ncbi:MAG: FGGY family carbohydrate kinase, partial [Nitrososphaeria archaeon]
MTYLMGIDAGTTAIKAAIYNKDGDTIAVSSMRVNIEKPKPGWVEEDMYNIWEATKFVIKDSLQKAKIDAGQIISIGLSSQGGGIWLVDEKGTPVRKAITWLDLRASNIVNKLKEKGLDKDLYDITGWRIIPGAGTVLLLWLQENEVNTLKKARYYLSCKDWIKFCLTGTFSTDPSIMIFTINTRKGIYSSEIFDIMGIDKRYFDLLPPMIHSWNIAGTINSKAAAETGLKEGTPVTSGGYDVCSTALGAGIINNLQLFAIIGTAGIYAAVADKPVFDPNRLVSVNHHVVPNLYLFNCQSMTATVNVDWFINEVCKDLLRETKE